jgi:hypothetical protein
MGHVTYTSKQRRLTTKKRPFSRQLWSPTIQLFWFWMDNLLCFEHTFYQKLATQQQVNERMQQSVQTLSFKCFSKNFWTFRLRVCFLPQMIAKHILNCKINGRWTDNWDDSLKTNIWSQCSGQFFRPQQSNFVCSNHKFVGDMAHYDLFSTIPWSYNISVWVMCKIVLPARSTVALIFSICIAQSRNHLATQTLLNNATQPLPIEGHKSANSLVGVEMWTDFNFPRFFMKWICTLLFLYTFNDVPTKILSAWLV